MSKIDSEVMIDFIFKMKNKFPNKYFDYNSLIYFVNKMALISNENNSNQNNFNDKIIKW